MKTFLKILALSLPLFFMTPKSEAQVRVGVDIHLGDPTYRPWPDAVWVPGYYYYEPEYGRRVWITGRWHHHDEGRHVGWYKDRGGEGRGHGEGHGRGR